MELHAGRYGPYVKHGSVNATLPDRAQADTLTLDEAVALLAAKSDRGGVTRPAKSPKRTRSSVSSAKPKAAVKPPRRAKTAPRGATRKRAPQT